MALKYVIRLTASIEADGKKRAASVTTSVDSASRVRPRQGVSWRGFCMGVTAVVDGNAGGRGRLRLVFVAFAPGRMAARSAVGGGAQRVDGLALEAESEVGVDAGGDADVGVTQQLLDHDEVDALFQEEGGGRVSSVGGRGSGCGGAGLGRGRCGSGG